MLNRQKYYEMVYEPGNWRKGFVSQTLRIQLKDIETRTKMGAYQEPYETTAVAIIKMLDKADEFALNLLGEMDAMSKELGETKIRLQELTQESLVVDETVQPEVGADLPKRTVVNPPTSSGRKGTKSK